MELRYFVAGAWEPADTRDVDKYNKRLANLNALKNELRSIEYENNRAPHSGLFTQENKTYIFSLELREKILAEEFVLVDEQERLCSLGTCVRQ